MLDHSVRRNDRGISVHAVMVHGKSRDRTHGIAHCKARYALAESLDLAGRFIPELGGQIRTFKVCARAEHRLSPVQAKCPYSNSNFSGLRRPDVQLIKLKHFRTSGPVEANDSRHGNLL